MYRFDPFDPCPAHGLESGIDGLTQDWANTTFCNPPYSSILKEAFIKKAFEESLLGKTIVLLLPACTGTRSFHNIILPNGQVTFLKGRIKFEGIDKQFRHCNPGYGMNGEALDTSLATSVIYRDASFYSMVVVFNGPKYIEPLT